MAELLKINKHLDDIPAEIIRQYINNQTCWVCGKSGWKALPSHLVGKHKLFAAEVREMAYMCKREKLISPDFSAELREKQASRLMEMRMMVRHRSKTHSLSKKGRDIAIKRGKAMQIRENPSSFYSSGKQTIRARLSWTKKRRKREPEASPCLTIEASRGL